MLLSAAVAVLVLVLCWVWWKQGYWTRRGVYTYPGDPLLGNIRQVLSHRLDLAAYFDQIYKKHKDKKLIGMYNFCEPMLLVTDVEYIRRIFVADYASFPMAVLYVNKNVDPLISHNPFCAYGEEWKYRRGIQTAGFTQLKLKEYVPMMQKVGEKMTQYIAGFKEKPLKVSDLAKFYTIDNVVSIALGYEPTAFTDEESHFRKFGKTMLDSNTGLTMIASIFMPVLVDIFRLRIIAKEAEDFFMDITKKIIDFRKNSKVVRNDLVDQLIKIEQKSISEGKKGMDTSEAAGHLMTTYVDSVETSSSLLSFLLLEVANRPEVQDRLREEMWAVGREAADFDFEKINSLVYLNMVLNEILRLHPLLYFFSRECKKDTKLGGVSVQKGTKVFIPYCSLINDPEYYPDPEMFIPERFSPANVSSNVKGTFFPFGEGPKQCLGMKYATLQIKFAVIILLLKFRLISVKVTDGKKVESAKEANLIAKPDDEETIIFRSL